MPRGRGIIHIDEAAPLGAGQRVFQLQGCIPLDVFRQRPIDGVGDVGFLTFEHGQACGGFRHHLEQRA